MQTRPLVPEDLKSDRSLIRAIVAEVLAELRDQRHNGEAAPDIAKANWPNDRTALGLLTRAASDPASTTGWGASIAGGTAVAAFIAGLRPTSAAARLMAAGTPLDLAGLSSISVPYVLATNLSPSWVVEGGAKGVGQDVLAGATLGPVKDLPLIVTASERLVSYSATNAETAMAAVLRAAASWQLDVAMFGATAAGAQPAGLLNGVSVTASASGTGVAGMLADISLLVDALVSAGLGSSPMIFASPSRAMRARGLAGGADLGIPIVSAPTLASGTIIAVDVGGFFHAIDPEPRIEVSREATLHMDTSAQALGVSGSATNPIRGLWQTNSVGVLLELSAAWVAVPGAVQYTTGAAW